MKYEIWFSPTARAEIIEAFEYIRNDQHAPLNAARWLDGIIDAISNLSDARTRIHWLERSKNSRKNFVNREHFLVGPTSLGLFCSLYAFLYIAE